MENDYYTEPYLATFGESTIKILTIVAKPYEHCLLSHRHERMEILYVIQGCLEISIDNNSFRASQSEAVIIMPNQQHNAVASSSGAIYNSLIFDVSDFQNSSTASERYIEPLKKGYVIFENKTNHPVITRIIRETVSETDPLSLVGKVYLLISSLYKHGNALAKNDFFKERSFKEVTSYISLHFAEPISVSSISKLFGYSEGYFSRKFKKTFGISASKYIEFSRLNGAIERIEKGNEKISEISRSCGFESPAYFSKRFYQMVHMTPKQYKKMCQEKEKSRHKDDSKKQQH